MDEVGFEIIYSELSFNLEGTNPLRKFKLGVVEVQTYLRLPALVFSVDV